MNYPKVLSAVMCTIVVLFHFTVFGGEDETQTWVYTEQYRYSATNGRAWKKLDLQSKITFLLGIEEGTNLLTLQMQSDKRPAKSIQDALTSGRNITISGFMFSDLTSQVDEFYSDSANIRVPVIEGYRYVLWKLKGVELEELQRKVMQLRREYNR